MFKCLHFVSYIFWGTSGMLIVEVRRIQIQHTSRHTQGRTQVELSGGLGPHSNLTNPFEFCRKMFRICGFTTQVPPVKVYAPTEYFL
jgi:hypothetical protein